MDTPQTPNSQIPASPNQNPAPTTPLAPAPASPAAIAASGIPSAVKTAGFFTGKMIAAIIGVAVVGGGIGAGYFIFPKPFYNTVGKYIGLPAPAAMEERAAGEENPPEGTENGTADADAEEAADGDNLDNLLNALPGKDANYVTYFQKTDEAATVVNELVNEAEKKFGKEIGDIKKSLEQLQALQKVGTSTEEMPEIQTFIDILSEVKRVLVVMKIDYETAQKARSTNPLQYEVPFALALAMPPEKETGFLEAVKTLQSLEKNGEENPFKKISVEGKGNGIIVITNPSHPLDGKFSDNPLKGGVEATFAETNLLIAFNLLPIIEKAVQEADAKADDPDFMTEEKKQQLELLRKVQNLVLSGALKKENGKSNLKIDAQVGMTDEEGAQKVLEFVKPQMEQLNLMIPPDYATFLKMEPLVKGNDFVFAFTVEDLIALEQKIFAALEASRRPREMTKPLIDESPANLPNLNQPEPSVLEGKVRRKKN